MDFREIAYSNQILRVRVGSHLFGTSTPDSDTDYEGIFMPPVEMLFGFKSCHEIDLGTVSKAESGRNTAEAVDYKVREFRDFCRLALENNPNILNVLFADDESVMFCNEYGKRLRLSKFLFPHLGCVRRYKGYAMSQMKKMKIKPDNYERLKSAEEVLSASDRGDILVEVVKSRGERIGGTNPFKDLGAGKHIQVGDIFLERGIKVSKALSTIQGRLERAGNRSKMWEKFGYDVKFASNLIQILMQGRELVSTGGLMFPLAEASLILDIKRGKCTAEEVQKMAEEIEQQIDAAEASSPLPKRANYKDVEQFVVEETIRWVRDHDIF